MSPLIERACYRNTSGQIIGVVKIDRKGDEDAKALLPDESVWLSEDERRATARAPRDPADNPFQNGHLSKVADDRITDADERPIDTDQAAPEAEAAPEPSPQPEEVAGGVEPATEPASRPDQRRSPVAAGSVPVEEEHADHREETAATPPPQGTPPQGEYAQAEEVATPDATKLSGREKAQEIKGADAIKVPPPRGERPSDS